MTIDTTTLVKLSILSGYGWLLIMMTLFAPPAAANPAALAWLDTQVQVGGSYERPDDIATPTQAIAETLRALHALGSGGNAGPASLAFLDTSTGQAVTEYLARALIAHTEAGTPAADVLTALEANQNPDGGFGAAPGFSSNVLDTAFALEAFSVAQYANNTLIGKALAYLQSQQRSDGGFGLNAANDSAIYSTAYVAMAFSRYAVDFQVTGHLDNAVNYLYARRTTAGDWGNSLDTAVALLAVVPASADSSRYVTAVDTLRASQDPDGSWEEDTYITALASRALYLASKVKPPINPSAGIFSGRITDSVSGLPLSGVQVLLDEAGSIQTASDINGRYVLDDVVPATYSLHYQADGYQPASKTASVVAGQQVDLGTVALEALPSVGFVAGQVTDVETGHPIANALIEMTGATTASVATLTDGSFRIASPPGTISVSVSATDYESAGGTAIVVDGGTLSFSPALRKTGSPPPPDPTVKIVGRVINASVNGAPLAGASIKVSGSGSGAASSDADGYFTLTGITAGQLRIVVSAGNYQSLDYSALAPEGSTVDLGIAALTPQPTAGLVVGTITAADTGSALANVLVEASGTPPVSATTAGDGTFHMTVMPGPVTVTASASGYEPVSGTGTLVAGGTLIFSPILSPVGTVPGNTTVTLIGTVTDADTQQQLDQANIVIVNTQHQTFSDSAGDFSLDGIAAGELTIEISKEGYQTLQFIAMAPAGSTIDLGTVSLQLSPGAGLITISGTVTDTDSTQPIAGAEINVEETGQSAISDQSGHFEIKDIDRLGFTLFTQAPGYLSALKMLSFSEPGTGHVNIGLSRFQVGGIKIDTVSTDKSDYEAYQPAPIAITISNAEVLAQRVQLLVEVVNPFGQIVQRSVLGTDGATGGTPEAITLLPGATKNFTSEWFTAAQPVGWYSVVARAFDPFTGQLISELSTLVHIIPSQHIDKLRVNATPRFTRVGAEEQVDISATVLNHANVETTLTLAYRLFDPELNPIKDGEATLIVQPEESAKTVRLTQFAHIFDQSGIYAIGIEVLHGPNPAALEIDTITVAPSIRVESSQAIDRSIYCDAWPRPARQNQDSATRSTTAMRTPSISFNRWLLAVLWLFAVIMTAPAWAAIDSKGTEHFFAFMPNYTDDPNLSLYITSEEDSQGTVQIAGLNFVKAFAVQANKVIKIDLPVAASKLPNNTKSRLGVKVIADREVTVYGLSRVRVSTDAFLSLPADTLGLKYLVMSNSSIYSAYPSEFVVAGVYDNTQVTITPSTAATGRPAGQPFTITLNSNDTFLLQGSGINDLTGSSIESSAPVAVLGGVKCANIPKNVTACDHIIEMMPPVSTWGKSFLTVPLATRKRGDVFRVLASQNNTVVKINGAAVATLNQGAYYETVLTTRSQIEASAPVLVAQYSPGQSFDGVISDPFMMLVPPSEQFLSHYGFSTLGPDVGFTNSFVNVVAPAIDIASILLDGTAVNPALFQPIGQSGFSGAQIQVGPGSHIIHGSVPFGIYVYGFGSYDSYGYPGGMAFDLINPQGDHYPPNVNLMTMGDTLNGVATDNEDINANGTLDSGEDLNGNNLLDRRTEDLNGNQILDAGEDSNGDGILDRDTGVFKIELAAGATNLRLNIDGFVPGTLQAGFQVVLINPAEIGSGILVVSDGAGNKVEKTILLSSKPLLTKVRVLSTLAARQESSSPQKR